MPLPDSKAGACGAGEVHMRILPLGERHFVPRVARNVRLLGVVRRGLETGALAWLPDGRYAQVNGDIVQPLDPVEVEAALQCAGMAVPRAAPAARQPAPASEQSVSRTPTVVIKRRRVIRLPGEGHGFARSGGLGAGAFSPPGRSPAPPVGTNS